MEGGWPTYPFLGLCLGLWVNPLTHSPGFFQALGWRLASFLIKQLLLRKASGWGAESLQCVCVVCVCARDCVGLCVMIYTYILQHINHSKVLCFKREYFFPWTFIPISIVLLVCFMNLSLFLCVCYSWCSSCVHISSEISLSSQPPNYICILIMSMFVQKHDSRSDMTKWK